jgi:hypothetical protein
MDLCSLEDAFPNIKLGPGNTQWKGGTEFPSVGGTDTIPSREERRAARKKAKKAKGVALAYSDSVVSDLPSTDPDRPAMKRVEPVEPEQHGKENFTTVMPVLPKASCMFSDTGTPKYFGKGVDDEEEGFATYSASANDDANYRLYPDFTQSDTLKGVEKAASKVLPEPPTDDTWKPITSAASYTAFHKDDIAATVHSERGSAYIDTIPEWSKKGSGSLIKEVEPANEYNKSEKDALLARIEMLMSRLEQLEKKTVKDSQTELLIFVGTGVFLLASFEFLTRR